MTYPTSQKIADALAAEPCAPEFEEQRQAMVALALQDHYHDFFGTAPCPITDLNNDCLAIGMQGLAARVRDGEFDATKEESNEWAGSAEGKAALGKLIGGRAPKAQKSLGDGPIQSEYAAKMTAIVQTLDELFNGRVGGPGRETGFVLLVFPFGEKEGRCNYMSNGANRDDIVTLFKEQIKRFEGQPDVQGNA